MASINTSVQHANTTATAQKVKTQSSSAFACMTVKHHDCPLWPASDLAQNIHLPCDLTEQEVAA